MPLTKKDADGLRKYIDPSIKLTAEVVARFQSKVSDLGFTGPGFAKNLEEYLKNAPDRALFAPMMRLVDALIAKDVNAKDTDGRTLLYRAVQCGDLNLVTYLLEDRKVEKDILDNAGVAILHLAAKSGHLHVVKYLVNECKMDIDTGAFLPLHRAAEGGHQEVVFGVSKTALYLAMEFGHLALVKFLLNEKGAKLKKDVLWYGPYGTHLSIVKFLLKEYKMDEKSRAEFDKNLLCIMAQYGAQEVVEWLITEGGYDIETENDIGQTALHIAASEGRVKLVEFLLDQGANIDVLVKVADETQDNTTPLSSAVQCERFEVAKLLLKRGARTDIKDASGESRLHLAARSKNPEMFNLVKAFSINDSCAAEIEKISLSVILPKDMVTDLTKIMEGYLVADMKAEKIQWRGKNRNENDSESEDEAEAKNENKAEQGEENKPLHKAPVILLIGEKLRAFAKRMNEKNHPGKTKEERVQLKAAHVERLDAAAGKVIATLLKLNVNAKGPSAILQELQKECSAYWEQLKGLFEYCSSNNDVAIIGDEAFNEILDNAFATLTPPGCLTGVEDEGGYEIAMNLVEPSAPVSSSSSSLSFVPMKTSEVESKRERKHESHVSAQLVSMDVDTITLSSSASVPPAQWWWNVELCAKYEAERRLSSSSSSSPSLTIPNNFSEIPAVFFPSSPPKEAGKKRKAETQGSKKGEEDLASDKQAKK